MSPVAGVLRFHVGDARRKDVFGVLVVRIVLVERLVYDEGERAAGRRAERERELMAGVRRIAEIVHLEMKKDAAAAVPELRAPDGIAVESPAIRVDGGRQISWRIRALRPMKGELEFVFPSQAIEKSVQAGVGPSYISERRVSSVLDRIWYPAESRLPTGSVDWIELRYPSATVHALGLDLRWLVWLALLSIISTLLLKRRLTSRCDVSR